MNCSSLFCANFFADFLFPSSESARTLESYYQSANIQFPLALSHEFLVAFEKECPAETFKILQSWNFSVDQACLNGRDKADIDYDPVKNTVSKEQMKKIHIELQCNGMILNDNDAHKITPKYLTWNYTPEI